MDPKAMTPFGRLLYIVFAPLWFPVVSVGVVGAFVLTFVFYSMLWSGLVALVSFVRYGDRFVLGNWSPPVLANKHDAWEYRQNVRKARRNLPNKPTVF